jgi:Zn-dependent membrane protease YugP
MSPSSNLHGDQIAHQGKPAAGFRHKSTSGTCYTTLSQHQDPRNSSKRLRRAGYQAVSVLTEGRRQMIP